MRYTGILFNKDSGEYITVFEFERKLIDGLGYTKMYELSFNEMCDLIQLLGECFERVIASKGKCLVAFNEKYYVVA